MKRKGTIRLYSLILIAAIVILNSCTKKSMEGLIVFTRIAGEIQMPDSTSGVPFEYIPESEILLLDPSKPEEAPQNLTADYFSAVSPEISYDGKFMLFSAQKESTDNWQIWEMDLDNLKARQLTFYDENCISPAYLPGSRFVFSKLTTNHTSKTGHLPFVGNLDGSEMHQICFNPHNYSGLSVLQDGRLLTISSQVYPEIQQGKLMVLRPDGTKQELFYQPSEGTGLNSQAIQIDNGNIVFIETDSDTRSENIISIRYNRPLNSRSVLTAEKGGNFYSVSSFSPGSLLVTHRPDGGKIAGLYEFNPEENTLSIIYKNENFNIIDAVVVAKRERPRKLPSEVNMGVKTGLLLCQDINFGGIETVDESMTKIKADKLEVMGIDSTLGIVEVEEDGSVYLKILADTPFRLRTISENGSVVEGPGNWIYLRPNERLGCVGCHAGNEQSPFNRQPLSVKKDPVVIPAHIKGIQEQKVSLE